MREFLYEVKDPMGFHARPAAALFMEAKKYKCSVTAKCGRETADVKDVLDIMGLGVTRGCSVAFRFDGDDENEAAEALQRVLAAELTEI